MFLTAAIRVSLFGLLYLLLGLFFLYRGQDMLKDRQKSRHRRYIVHPLWLVLLYCMYMYTCIQLLHYFV